MLAKSVRSRLLILALVALAPGLVVCGGSSPSVDAGESETVTVGPPPEMRHPKLADVDKLVEAQKLAEAVTLVEAKMVAAHKSGDDELLALLLILRTQLRTALGGYETAVRELKAEAWPKQLVPEIVVDLYYAHTLTTYVRGYGWEIRQREKVDTKGAVDLKLWTQDQIVAEATRTYASVWKRRAQLGAWPSRLVDHYLALNTYPAEIRGTLRDVISYLFVDHLADTSLWRADQSNDLFRIDFAQLLRGGGSPVDVESDAHPLEKIGGVLDDLEGFHARAGRKQAALEARLERLRRLYASYPDQRVALTAALVERLAIDRPLPWWAMGQSLYAEWERGADRPVHARALAAQGARAYPGSMGGAICKQIVAELDAASYSLSTMTVDGLDKPSLLVESRNLGRLYLRAYAVDLRKRLEDSKDYNFFSNPSEMHRLLSTSPMAAWSVKLPATPDLRSHRSFVTPAIKRKGSYVILASARADWNQDKNEIVGAYLTISDLVLSTRQNFDGSADVTVFDGATGRPLPGVSVEEWSFDWQRGHRHDTTVRTGDDGVAHVTRTPSPNNSVFFLATRGDELTVDPTQTYLSERGASRDQTSALIYTDRSVYRPGQKIFWKAVVYSGRSEDGKFKVLPARSFVVSLRDANYQEVARVPVRSNAYGSAAGEFTIPASGRLLGRWDVAANIGGSQNVRVEEYKRPTFEVTLKAPPTPLRLNEPARLTGEARYYFGLPVSAGQARYTITREPVFPSWWGWYFHDTGNTGTQTIAQGIAPLRADGSFEVKFLPEARANVDAHVSYRYHVSASVTDEGGETRNADRSYHLGYATIEASARHETGFFAAGHPIELSIARADLDGNPRAGKGSWRILALDAPAHAQLPAEIDRLTDSSTASATLDEKRIVTAGDKHNARFETNYAPLQVIARWKDAAVLQQGELTSTTQAETPLTIAALPAGVYRLRYETSDDHGTKTDTFCDFFVAGDQPPALPLFFTAERRVVPVGDRVRLFAGSGLSAQPLVLETFREGRLIERKLLDGGARIIERPIAETDRGGLAFVLTAVRDHQLMRLEESVTVPWDNQSLKLSFATFRDKIRPGARETFRVTVESDGRHPTTMPAGAAELLAYMYDRSLDLFAPHHPANPLGLFPNRSYPTLARLTLSRENASALTRDTLATIPAATRPLPDRYDEQDSYGIGGMGMVAGIGRGGGSFRSAEGHMGLFIGAPAPMKSAPAGAAVLQPRTLERTAGDPTQSGEIDAASKKVSTPEAPVRSNFAETAFWKPNLITDGKGEASFEFTVPDSVTSWSVWVHAITKDLRSGSVQKETRSVKDLLVRPYLPRFLREGDRAELKVVVNNAGTAKLDGSLAFDIIDPETKLSKAALFSAKAESRAFSVEAGKSTNLTFPVVAPRGVGQYAILARATAKSAHESFSDGELRPVPLLPSRLHLTQSRFVTLRDADRRTMKFDDLARNESRHDDTSLTNEQLVVTLDAQLFYTVLRALPYLINYPYECAEQTLNRFVSTAIVSSLFAQYPEVGKMADQMSKRTTQLASWDAGDANRKMALEEAPFLFEAKGGHGGDDDALINVLDQRIARANRDSALEKLKKMQTSLGAFPWFPGGPPSPYMTLYVLYGFAKAAEFKVDVPKEMVQRGWQYLAIHYRDDLRAEMKKAGCCWEFLALLNYVASSYPDASWTGDALTLAERKEILDYTFKHWKQTSPYVKGLLALTLKRTDRAADGKTVFDSVMDSAKTAPDQGTFWAQEDRSWLWYNDTIESQAFALRVLMELDPQNPKKDGLVLWLLLNKKLNQWKSTRATAEVIYSLAEYMKADHSLGIREAATVRIGARQQTFAFEPDQYVGKLQMIVPGAEVNEKSAQITVEKQTKGVMFASATWSFSTDKLPTEGRGDFFAVDRKYFLRENNGKEFVLRPLADGTVLHPGDEVEVQLAISTKHEAEYVHLRDPRGAGFEPTSVASGYKWNLGIGYYEEVRDSGANFFFEQLPVGEYTFKYRIRATTAGTFRVGPATLQSMYAPEFSAYSAGHVLKIAGQ